MLRRGATTPIDRTLRSARRYALALTCAAGCGDFDLPGTDCDLQGCPSEEAEEQEPAFPEPSASTNPATPEDFVGTSARLRRCVEVGNAAVANAGPDPYRYSGSDPVAVFDRQQRCLIEDVLDDAHLVALEERHPYSLSFVFGDTPFDARVCTIADAVHSTALSGLIDMECRNRAFATRMSIALLVAGVEDAPSFAAATLPSCVDEKDLSIEDEARQALECARAETNLQLGEARIVLELGTGLDDAACFNMEEVRGILARDCESMFLSDRGRNDWASVVRCQLELEALVPAVFSSLDPSRSPSGMSGRCSSPG